MTAKQRPLGPVAYLATRIIAAGDGRSGERNTHWWLSKLFGRILSVSEVRDLLRKMEERNLIKKKNVKSRVKSSPSTSTYALTVNGKKAMERSIRFYDQFAEDDIETIIAKIENSIKKS